MALLDVCHWFIGSLMHEMQFGPSGIGRGDGSGLSVQALMDD
jgi:hypothetical protein